MNIQGRIGSIVLILLAFALGAPSVVYAQAAGNVEMLVGMPEELGESIEGVEEARVAVEQSSKSSIFELYRIYNISINEIFDYRTFQERIREQLTHLQKTQSNHTAALTERRNAAAAQILASGDELSPRDRAALWEWLSARFVTAGSHSETFFGLLLDGYPALVGFEAEDSTSSFFATAFAATPVPEVAPDVLLELWLLHAAALPFVERMHAQEAMVEALRDRGEFDALVTELESELVEARVERRLRLDESSPDPAPASALAAAHPAAFASTDDYLPDGLDTAAVRRGLRLASSRDESFVLRLAESSFAFRFFLERIESLLRLASPAERAAFAQAIGLDYVELQRMVPRLSYALSRPDRRSALAWPDGSTAGAAANGYRDDELVHFFDLYREQGAGLAADLSRRVGDDESNNGPEYRWALLSTMNHPYALFALSYPEAVAEHVSSDESLSGAEAAQAREAIREFAEQLYRRTLGSLGGDERLLSEVPGGVGYMITDRLYQTADEDLAARFYRAFVAAAQDLDPLPESFFEPYAPGIDRANHWSHQHGLNVAVSRALAAREPDGFVEPWFSLWEAASIPDEGFSHAIRGAAAIQRSTRASLATLTAANGEPGIATLAPRTAALVEVAQEMLAFRLLPDEGVRRIEVLLPPRSGRQSIGARVEGVIASEMERAVYKLEQAGRGERFAFDQLRGTRSEER